jgi:hypothetical protein
MNFIESTKWKNVDEGKRHKHTQEGVLISLPSSFRKKIRLKIK